MIEIEQSKNILLFRFSNYKRYDFVLEHNKVVEKNGFSWVLKNGKIPDSRKIQKVLDDGGWIVIKTPKASGNKFYITQMTEYSSEAPKNNIYPAYYSSFISDQYGESNSGIWMKIGQIISINEAVANTLVLANGGKPVMDVINRTMTSFMFVNSTEKINL